jgi:NADPH:quinone reductase-like Zn-dependent oxidoreductase
MRRVRYHHHGGPDVLAIEESAIPQPGPGQVLIRAEMIGLNYVDVQLRRETAPESIWFRPLPGTLTGDVVGTVEAAGPGADSALVGTRVAALLEDACADYAVAGTDWLVSVPEELDAGAATMLPLTGPVALGALRTGQLATGGTVLITAGAGAIGHLAVQLARQLGAGTVLATASSPAKRDLLLELGADHAIDYTQPGWADEVRAAAPGGVGLALDAVGGQAMHTCLDLLAPHGRLVVYGASAGEFTDIPVRSLYALKTVTGFSLLAWRAADPDQARAATAELTRLFQAGKLRAAVAARLPLTDIAKAHELLEDRAVTGRLLLMP